MMLVCYLGTNNREKTEKPPRLIYKGKISPSEIAITPDNLWLWGGF